MRLQIFLIAAFVAVCAYGAPTLESIPARKLDLESKEAKDLISGSLKGLNEKSPSQFIYTVVEIKKVEQKMVNCICYNLELIVVENKNCPKKGSKNFVCNEKANDLDDKQLVTIEITGTKSNRKYEYELESID